MKAKKNTNIMLIVLLMLSFFMMLYFGHKKQGYHIDEIYSYGLSNSEYLPFMHFGESGYDVKDWMKEYGAGESLLDLCSNLLQDVKILKEHDFQFYDTEIYKAYQIAQENSADTYTTTWVSGTDYQDYLAASKSNTFNYASVYYNQRGDVHPPFFYILLHTICSIFQGCFSKWFGLGLNIVILLFTICMLYKMCKKHFGGTYTAIAIACMYACSVGFMSTAMFIRMYALLTCMTVLCTFAHLELYASDFTLTKKRAAAIFFSVLGGYYTQYYFVLYAIVMAAVMLVCMFYKRRFKSVGCYAATLAAAAGVGIVIWPFSIKHVFSGYRGQESLGILQSGHFYWYKAKYMLGHISDNIFGGHIKLAAVIVLICIGLVIFFKKGKAPYGKAAILSLPIICYTLVVGQISPFLTDRYVMCTYPFWCVMFIASVQYAWNCCQEHVYICKKSGVNINKYIAVGIGIIAIICNNYIVHVPGYLNKGGQETYQVYPNTDCIFIIPDGSYNESSEEIPILAQCRNVGIVYESNLSVLKETYTYQSGDYLLVEIVNSLDENIVLENVRKMFGIESLKELDREYAGCAVRILLGE